MYHYLPSARAKLVMAQSGISPIWICIMCGHSYILSVTEGDLNGYGMNSNLLKYEHLQH